MRLTSIFFAFIWIVGVIGRPFPDGVTSPAGVSWRAYVRATGSSNRGGSVASGAGASSIPGEDVRVCLTPVARSIGGAFGLGARSSDARAGMAMSAGTRCTTEASFGAP